MSQGRGRRVFDMGRYTEGPGSFRILWDVPVTVNIAEEPAAASEASPREAAQEFARIEERLLGNLNEEHRRQIEWYIQMASIREGEMRRHLEEEVERREAMAKAPTNTVQLETGEQREANASNRVFFVYVTPTGAELALSKCPSLSREFTKTEGAFGSNSRRTLAEYNVKAPCILKMVNLQSSFGKPRRVVNMMIEIDPEAATIEVKGLEGFGMFKGRAKVLPKQSTYFVNRENFSLTTEVLKEHFGLRTLQPPVKAGAAGRARSLIF